MSKTTNKIDTVETTDLNLSGRSGLALFDKYLLNSGMIKLLASDLSFLSQSKKGLSVENFIKQMGAYFIDGTNHRISQFDKLKADDAYAKLLGLKPEELGSSAAISRYFDKFNIGNCKKLKKSLKRIFRKVVSDFNGSVIVLTLDSMVLDNDDSNCKQGCTPSYKKVKGFHPLQLIVNGHIVSVSFRGGKTHGNCADTAKNMIIDAIKLIREIKGANFPIVFNMDSGFMDQKLFNAINENNANFICSGKKYPTIKDIVEGAESADWHEYIVGKKTWAYYEFVSGCKSWEDEYRTIYTYLSSNESGQYLLQFGDSESVIYTNIDSKQSEKSNIILNDEFRSCKSIIATFHSRGADELPHRAIKEFGSEILPFKKYHSNEAYYLLMVTFFNMYEFFKKDIIIDKEFQTSYPNTIRRKFIDIAGYITTSGGKIILKINHAIATATNFLEMWQKCCNISNLFLLE